MVVPYPDKVKYAGRDGNPHGCDHEASREEVLAVPTARNPGQSKSWLFNQDGKNFRIKGDRLDELEQMGLVRFDKAPRVSNVILVYPTDAGSKIAEAILSVYPEIRQQECDPEDY